MKKYLLDFVFIIIAGAVLALINELGYSNMLSRFSMLVIMVGYFAGKFVGSMIKRN